MIQVKNIVDALYGLIGWRADFSNEVKIDSGLTESKSGLYYQDAHPLLTLKNLASIAPDFANMDWPEWDKDKAYQTGDLAAIYGEEQKGFDLYRCIADNTGQDPQTDNSQYWAVVSPFSAWLEEKTRASIANAVTHFVFNNMPKGGTKSILEHRLLFNTVGRIGDRIANGGNLVGLEVHPIHAYDVCVDIHKIGLQAINKDNMQATGNVDLIVKSSNDMLGELSREALNVGGYQTKYKELNKQVANTQGGQTLSAMYFSNSPDSLGVYVGDKVDVLFNLDVNEWGGRESAQIIVRDLKPSITEKEKHKVEQARFEEIRNGAVFTEAEHVLPDREDFAAVYRLIHNLVRADVDVLKHRDIISRLKNTDPMLHIGYVKLKVIIMVFKELNILSIEDIAPDTYKFKLYYSTAKKKLDKSTLLRRLRSQMLRRG